MTHTQMLEDKAWEERRRGLVNARLSGDNTNANEGNLLRKRKIHKSQEMWRYTVQGREMVCIAGVEFMTESGRRLAVERQGDRLEHKIV